MALWGNDNVIASAGTVSLDYVEPNWVVTGSGTSFGTPGTGKPGDVIVIGNTLEELNTLMAVIVGIASTTVMTVLANPGLATTTDSMYYISELPVYTTQDASNQIGIYKTTSTRTVLGITTSLGVISGIAHEGWNYLQMYQDCHGEMRVKTEVLVAMSGISSFPIG